MKKDDARIRIPQELYRDFKIICLKNNLQPTKQMIELVKKFLEIMGQDDKLVN